MREREGLIARIRQIRGAAAATTGAPRVQAPKSNESVLQDLQARIGHLEQLVEALQDSVHRESERHGKRISELESRLQPGALNASLSKDARDRGL